MRVSTALSMSLHHSQSLKVKQVLHTRPVPTTQTTRTTCLYHRRTKNDGNNDQCTLKHHLLLQRKQHHHYGARQPYGIKLTETRGNQTVATYNSSMHLTSQTQSLIFEHKPPILSKQDDYLHHHVDLSISISQRTNTISTPQHTYFSTITRKTLEDQDHHTRTTR